MTYKFWCIIESEFFTPLPGQGDDIIFGQSIRFILDKHILKKYRLNQSLFSPEEHFLYECIVDNNKYLISIENHILSLTNVTKIAYLWDLCKENLDYNLKQKKIKSSNTVKRKSHPIPADIFIDQLTWDIIISSIELGVYLLIFGPTGAGKTAIIYAAAKYLGYDFYPLSCGTLGTPEKTLIGSVQAKDGSTFIVESEFLKFFKSDKPTLIFLNELNRTPQGATNYMMTILDKLQSFIYVKELGQRIYKGDKVKFIADSNIGKKYSDTRSLDAAFSNRFPIKTIIDYLPEEEEIKLVKQKVPDANEKDIRRLIKTANLIRQQEEQLMVSISTREIIEMSRFFSIGFTVNEVVENLVKNIFIDSHSSNKETISKIFDSIS